MGLFRRSGIAPGGRGGLGRGRGRKNWFGAMREIFLFTGKAPMPNVHGWRGLNVLNKTHVAIIVTGSDRVFSCERFRIGFTQERILASYDQKRRATARKSPGASRVSLGLVKKLFATAPTHRGQLRHATVFPVTSRALWLASSAADAGFAGEEAGPDLGRVAPSHAAGLHPACHPLRPGEDGADI